MGIESQYNIWVHFENYISSKDYEQAIDGFLDIIYEVIEDDIIQLKEEAEASEDDKFVKYFNKWALANGLDFDEDEEEDY